MTKNRLVLFDGTGLLVRCARVPGVARLQSSGEVPTGPLMLFARVVSRLLKESFASHVAVAWDGPEGRAARLQAYPGYKSGREPFSGGWQFELAREFLGRAGIFQYLQPQAEADDLIAAFWRTARALMPDHDIVICSDDGDLHQLIDELTVQRGLSNYSEFWDLEKVLDHYGGSGNKIPMLKALAGDPSDNIPGIHGIGPKTARKVLESSGWDLGKAVADNGFGQEAMAYYQVMDLDQGKPRRLDDAFVLGFEESLRWDPDAAEPGLREFLQRYDLAYLLQRLDEKRLWGYGT